MIDFTASTTSGATNLSVSFTSSGASAPVSEYLWNFGDNFISSEVNPEHVYSEPGIYDVILTVTYVSGTVETESKEEYIQVATPSSSVLPENDCCFGPYTISCIGCTSSSGDLFYDSSKKYRVCKDADCSLSCEAEYGSAYTVIYDGVAGCPTCRECYLESETLARQYTLTITNCQIYITDFVADSSCGSCLGQAEEFCFTYKKTDENICENIFEFDDKIFVVTGEPGDCGVGIDCGACWDSPNAPMGEHFEFLPSDVDNACETEETISDTFSETTVEPVISWHNTPSTQTGVGTTCSAEEAISSEEESYQNPDIAIVQDHSSAIVYEKRTSDGLSRINVARRQTSVENKVTHWRSLGKGLLLNSSLTEGSSKKIRIYDIISLNKTNLAIGFKTGPLTGKVYQIDNISKQPVPVLINSSNYTQDIHVDSDNGFIYYGRWNVGAAITRSNLDGGSTTSLVTQSAVHSILSNSNNQFIYILCHPSNFQIRLFDGTSNSLLKDFTNATATQLAMDIDTVNQHIYYSDAPDIKRIDLDGSNETTIHTMSASRVAVSFAINPSSSHLYWTEYENGTPGQGRIRRINLNSSGLETIIDSLDNDPYGIAVDNQRGLIYWSERNGKIKSINEDGTNAKTIFSSTNKVGNIAINKTGTKVYWIEGSEQSGQTYFFNTSKVYSMIITDRPYYEITFSTQVFTET